MKSDSLLDQQLDGTYNEAKYIAINIEPAIISVSAQNVKPFGFHESRLNISDGPMTCFPDTAFAVAASIAACRLARLIPPEPRRNRTPIRMKIMPSRNAASVAVK